MSRNGGSERGKGQLSSKYGRRRGGCRYKDVRDCVIDCCYCKFGGVGEASEDEEGDGEFEPGEEGAGGRGRWRG